MANNTKVFISYSHDSPEHKQWVLELATELRHSGIDAILDQWDLGLGNDITLFIDHGIRNADRVLVICTDKYVEKANSAKGGVGYERMIVTAELMQDLGTDKFIPVIRQTSKKEKTPTFLGTRVYADYRDEKECDEEFSKLIHALYGKPFVQKPPLGERLFTEIPSDKESHTRLPNTSKQVKSIADAYNAAAEIIRVEDSFEWRQLIKHIKSDVFNSLEQWGEHEQKIQQTDSKEPFQVVDEVVEIILPLMITVLAGVESHKEAFRDQKLLLDDLENVARQNLAGLRVNIPRALGYIYHSLHGSISVHTKQPDVALSLARVNITDIFTTDRQHLWERSDLMGWSKSLGGNCKEGWKYLSEAFERWEWLSLLFGNQSKEYRSSLVAYYMALNIHELAVSIATGKQKSLIKGYSLFNPYHFNVPLTFMSENEDIFQQAQSVLLRSPDALKELWTISNVTQEQMKNHWENWVNLFGSWMGNVYRPSSRIYYEFYDNNLVNHQKFFEML